MSTMENVIYELLTTTFLSLTKKDKETGKSITRFFRMNPNTMYITETGNIESYEGHNEYHSLSDVGYWFNKFIHCDAHVLLDEGYEVNFSSNVHEFDNKYAILYNQKINENCRTLCRIIAVREIYLCYGGCIEIGTIGGYVEKESNLSQSGECWIGGDAKVYGNAKVSNHAHVKDDAVVKDNAIVTDMTLVDHGAIIKDYATVSASAYVSGNSVIYGNSKITDKAFITGNGYVHGHAWIGGKVLLQNENKIYGNVKLSGDMNISDSQISGNVHIRSNLTIIHANIKDMNLDCDADIYDPTNR